MQACASAPAAPSSACGTRAACLRPAPFPSPSSPNTWAPPSRQPRRPSRQRPVCAAAAGSSGDGVPLQRLVAVGPGTPPPDYTAIDLHPLNRVVYSLFRARMVQAIGSDSQLKGCGGSSGAQGGMAAAPLPLMRCPRRPTARPSLHPAPQSTAPCCPASPACRYDAIIDLTRRLNTMHGSAHGTQVRACVPGLCCLCCLHAHVSS